MSLPELERFRRFLLLERKYSPLTAQAYGRDLLFLVAYLEQQPEPIRLRQCTPTVLRQFLMSRAADRTSRTLARCLGSLRAFYAYAERFEGFGPSPAARLKMPKLPKRLPLVLSAQAMESIVTEGAQPSARGHRATVVRDRAMLELLYGAGLRVSEAAQLRISDIDWAAGTLRVLGKGRKERSVPLGGAAQRALEEYLTVRAELAHERTGAMEPDVLFVSTRGRPWSARRIEEMVHQAGVLAAGRSDLHPHALRHACATHMLEGGADLRAIQDFLGHETVATTQKYTHVSVQQLARVYDASHPFAKLNRLPGLAVGTSGPDEPG